MSKSSTDAHVGRHVRCRNLIWETAADGSHVPGRYCENRLGVVHALDCPVFQGGECCLFEPRPEDELAEVPDEAGLDRIRTRLARDYLRWPYWRRLEVLRGAEAPDGEVEDLPDIIEVGPEEPEESDETDEAAVEMPPAPPEEAVHERYPGQRRSEEEQRARRGEEADSLPPVGDDFVKGIFAAEPEEATAPPDEEPAAPPDAKQTENSSEEKAPSKRRRRRRRPRRGRGRGKGKTDKS